MRPALQAAGALVWRERGRKLQVLLVHRPRYNDWSWPKGKPESGEPLVATAVREVSEETGKRIVLGQPLGCVRYRVGGRPKETHYWAATAPPAGAWARARPSFRPASVREVDDVAWFDAKAAWKRLTYERDRDPLARLIDQWQDGRLDTWTVAIVRHGRARKRAAWKGGEDTRPLTALGSRQAVSLVPILSAFGISSLLTSPWERCAATLRPYEAAAGLDAEARTVLTEEAHAESRKPVRALVEAELAHPTPPVAICTHRPVLPTVMSQLTVHTPNSVRAQLPGSDPWLKPGEVFLAHLANHPRRSAVLVAGEVHRPCPGPASLPEV